jgi:acylpyruvate hydrolase
MQLVTLKNPAGGRPGLILGEEILDIAAAAPVLPMAGLCPSSVRQIIAAGADALDLLRRLTERAGEGSAADRLRELGALVPRAGAALDAPIPDPGFILACGRNYRAHVAEFNSNMDFGFPTGFSKSVRAVIGPNEAIRLPRKHPDMVDWEAEFCAVIGKPCHGVSEAEAMDYVWGYTQVNDVSARNWAMVDPAKRTTTDHDRNLLGKQFPTFCPMGPAVVSADEIADPHDLHIGLRLNGEVMQDGHTKNFIFTIPQLIAYYAQFYRLMPGDVVTTGSPSGVGLARKPPMFLKAGDLVEVFSDAIGVLANPVAAG